MNIDFVLLSFIVRFLRLLAGVRATMSVANGLAYWIDCGCNHLFHLDEMLKKADDFQVCLFHF